MFYSLSEEHQLHGHRCRGQIVLPERCLHGRLQYRQVGQVLVHLGLPHEVPWAKGSGALIAHGRPMPDPLLQGPPTPAACGGPSAPAHRLTSSPKIGERLLGQRL